MLANAVYKPGRALDRHKGGMVHTRLLKKKKKKMVDDWGQSAPGKTPAPPNLRWESGTKKCGYLSGIYGIPYCISRIFEIMNYMYNLNTSI